MNGLTQIFKERSTEYHSDLADELGAEQVSFEMGDAWRWGHWEHYVYKRGDEYVRLDIQVASGDSEVDYEHHAAAVAPVEKTVVHYEVIK